MRLLLCFLGLVLVGSGLQAHAKASCTNIHERTARLACYDKAAGYVGPNRGMKLPEVQRVPKATSQIPSLETETTPAALPAPIAASPEPQAPAPQELAETRKKKTARTYAVTKLDETNTGKALVFFADGQVWQQTDSVRVRVGKTAPDEATIKPAAIGSFFLKWDGQRQFRAKRVR